MKKIDDISQLQIGSVVVSTMGRDKGDIFAVVTIVDKQFVKLCDGKKHRLSSPKLKSIKHIKADGTVLSTIAAKLIEGKKVFDSELKSSLNACQQDLVKDLEDKNV